MRECITLVSRLRPGCPFSAEFVIGVVLVHQFDVCEGKVATFAITFTLPLAVHIYFGHLHHVAHLEREIITNYISSKIHSCQEELKQILNLILKMYNL